MTHPGYKPSRFLHAITLDSSGEYLLFNAYTGGLLRFAGDSKPRVEDLLRRPALPDDAAGASIFGLLREQGFLVPITTDERSVLEYRSRSTTFARSPQAVFTICPTLSCNFSCHYCFQDHAGMKRMPPMVRDRVKLFVLRQAATAPSLNVTWFGGEPTTAIEVVGELSESFQEFCAQADIPYRAHMISNGYQLDRRVGERLSSWGVNTVQITIDGPREVHDARRNRFGKPSYDRIIENISACADLFAIAIRINVDQDNIADVEGILDDLDAAGLRGRVSCYLAPVRAYTEVCEGVSGVCLSGPEYARLESEFETIRLQRGYGPASLPRPIEVFCQAVVEQGAVIASNGLIYKCWNDVTDPREAVGRLDDNGMLDSTEEQRARHRDWLEWSPFANSSCTGCSVLPLCLGGCPHQAMRRDAEGEARECSPVKHNLGKRIATSYLSIRIRSAMERTESMVGDQTPEAQDIAATSPESQQSASRSCD